MGSQHGTKRKDKEKIKIEKDKRLLIKNGTKEKNR